MKETATSPKSRWTPGVKAAVSLFIVFHVLAVFWAPFLFATMSPDGGSPVANYPAIVFECYYQPLYLDHGYSFFAPNPGPTHVVDFRVFNESGDVIQEGRFPSKSQHLPRLRYHRYFMLGGTLSQMWVRAETPDPSLPPDVRKDIIRRRADYVMLKTAIEQGLAREYGGTHAVVQRVVHRSPTYREFMEGWSLTDPRLFETLPEQPPKEEELQK